MASFFAPAMSSAIHVPRLSALIHPFSEGNRNRRIETRLLLWGTLRQEKAMRSKNSTSQRRKFHQTDMNRMQTAVVTAFQRDPCSPIGCYAPQRRHTASSMSHTFSLLETILYEPDNGWHETAMEAWQNVDSRLGFYLLDLHVARLLRSARSFLDQQLLKTVPVDADFITRRLKDSVPDTPMYKRVSIRCIVKGRKKWNISLSNARFDSCWMTAMYA